MLLVNTDKINVFLVKMGITKVSQDQAHVKNVLAITRPMINALPVINVSDFYMKSAQSCSELYLINCVVVCVSIQG